MKNIIVIAIVLGLISFQCKTQKPINMNQAERALINTNTHVGEATPSNYIIQNAFLEGDILKLTVEFTGGNVNHDFDLVWDGAIMKSRPPKALLQLVHKSENITGNKKVVMNMSFNLSSMKTAIPSGESVILLIGNSDTPLTYILR
jgi:hypothetical protein